MLQNTPLPPSTLIIILRGGLIKLLTIQLPLAGSSKMMLSERFSVSFTSWSPVASNIVMGQLLGCNKLYSSSPAWHSTNKFRMLMMRRLQYSMLPGVFPKQLLNFISNPYVSQADYLTLWHTYVN